METSDLERLAVAAHLVASDDAIVLWAAAHDALVRAGHPARAARCAFWVAQSLVADGEPARGQAWVARAQRLLDDAGLECAEQGYLLVPPGS